VARFPEVRLLRNDRNHGKGFAVRHGALEARGRFILLSDADLSAPIEEADRLLAALESSGADAAIGAQAFPAPSPGRHAGCRSRYCSVRARITSSGYTLSISVKVGPGAMALTVMP
jgi:glycosyltransferase involved in cell wall biosynthesis